MADNPLADRVRLVLADEDVAEKKMFGGTCFLLNGNMILGASPRGLMVRVGKENNTVALARPNASPMIHSGRPIDGFIVVANEGVSNPADLADWVGLGLAHVRTLPPKSAKPARKPRPRKSA